MQTPKTQVEHGKSRTLIPPLSSPHLVRVSGTMSGTPKSQEESPNAGRLHNVQTRSITRIVATRMPTPSSKIGEE
ncbi:hypothetical protein LINPERHAP1_LOCUS18105 [Linum perenne]